MTWEPAPNLSKGKEMLVDYKIQHGLGEIKVKLKRMEYGPVVDGHWFGYTLLWLSF
jgi:hypothetical protein